MGASPDSCKELIMSRLGKGLETAKANFTGARDGFPRGDDSRQMPITVDRVREIIQGLESGDGAAFFDRVADNRRLEGDGHPPTGRPLPEQESLAGTFAKLGQVLPNGAQLRTEHLIVKDDHAVVELHSFATAKNRMRFDNRYCWVVRFRNGVIILGTAHSVFGLAARFNIRLPRMKHQAAEALVVAAHEVCPYSRATRGNTMSRSPS